MYRTFLQNNRLLWAFLLVLGLGGARRRASSTQLKNPNETHTNHNSSESSQPCCWCGESQQSAPAPEAQPVEPVAEAAKPETPTAKAPDISIHDAAKAGNIEAVKQHLAAGADVNAKDDNGFPPLHLAAVRGHSRRWQAELYSGFSANPDSFKNCVYLP
jgi:ankyrin repeat protein